MEICSLFDDSFRKDSAGDKSKFKKEEYFDLTLFAVVILPTEHPLVYRSHEHLTVKNTIIGCSRLSRYHLLLSKMAKDFVEFVLVSVCSVEIADRIMHSRSFSLIREQARQQLRHFLLSENYPEHKLLNEQWKRFEEVERLVSIHQGPGDAAASTAADTLSLIHI